MESHEGTPYPARKNTVHFWRAGEKMARQQRTSDWQSDYDAAIASAVVVLGRYHTMDSLIAAYFDDTVDDDWVESLCRLRSGRVLSFSIVEDAAYWRRLKQLLSAQ